MPRRTRLTLKPPNWIDRVVGYVSPSAGRRRVRDRMLYSLAASESYDAAVSSRLHTGRPSLAAADDGDSHLDSESLAELRRSSRHLDRNNGLSIGIIDRSVEQIVGPYGFTLHPKTRNKTLNKRILSDWKRAEERLDARGELHFWQLIPKLYKTSLIDGDAHIQKDDRHEWLRSFEGDRITNPVGRRPRVRNLELINGVAVDGDGRRRWLFVANPIRHTSALGSSSRRRSRPLSYDHVTAEQGKVVRAETVLSLANPRRLTQTRGCPVLAPVIREIDDIDDLLKFERIGAKLAAAQGFFVRSEDPLGIAELLRNQNQQTWDDDRIEEVEPGSIHYLRANEDIVSVESQRPNRTFRDFVLLLNRYVGVPLGLPLELVLLDFSHVNFASSRQLLNIAHRKFRCEQFNLSLYCSQIYRWWMGRQLANGRYQERDDIFAHEWEAPGWASPNPLQDAQALALGLEWGFDTRTRFAGQYSGNPISSVFDGLEWEQAELDRRGIRIGKLPKQSTMSGQPPEVNQDD